MRITIGALSFFVASSAAAWAQSPPDCREHFNSTFELIQEVVFERHGCTSGLCHSGPNPAGGLDLSPEVAYDNLVDRPVKSIASEQYPGIARVVPSNKARSLLWLNLAGATLPHLWQAPLRPMPLGGLPPLGFEELELVRMWIEYGATRDGVVPGTGEAFNACLPPPKPLKVAPLPPPPPGVGVQIRAPHQVLPPRSERETCFVSYYDLTDQVPEQFRGPDGTTFRYNRVDARQDPLSHHAVVIVYQGTTPISDPAWGPFTCKGGARDGQPCRPTERDACGEGGLCGSEPVPAVACIGYGPGDASIGTGEKSLFSTMGGAAIGGSEGIYEEVPLKGILVWNSHAFNLTDQPAGLDIWVNFEFAPPERQLRPLRRFVDISALFKMNAPAYGLDEVCQHHVLPAGARVLDFASHTHKRGKRFQIFEGKFSCEGGPHHGAPCTPFGPTPGLPVPDLCAGAPCLSKLPPRAGDCNGDLDVTVDEVILGVGIALSQRPMGACPRFDADQSGGVGVHELVSAVGSVLQPDYRDPEESLFYTTLTYADPLILAFNPPRSFGGLHAVDEERTVTYCALYDNGFTNPDEVKRKSRVPSNGVPCQPTHCAEGLRGRPCSSDRHCDTAPGTADGLCDACPVGFGVTTDDEMFVLTGSYVLD